MTNLIPVFCITLFASLLYLTCAFSATKDFVSPDADVDRIVGGVETRRYEFPWIVGVRTNPGQFSRHSCGGSIISSKWIVTAAHCAQSAANWYEIVAGDHNLTLEEGTEQRSLVSEIFVHENYDDYYLENDIALMKLTTPFVLNEFVGLASLALPGFEVEGTNMPHSCLFGMLTVAGWGRLSFNGQLPDVLMKVDVPTISLDKCRELYPQDEYPVFDHNVCAGYLDGVYDSCNGDSGGPLMCLGENSTQPTLCGLVSWGGTGFGSCAAPNEPGVYTEISKFYEWILQKVLSSP